MTSQDILYYAMAFGFLLVAGAIWYLTISIVDMLQQLKPIFQNLKQLTDDIDAIGSTVKSIQRGFLSNFMGLIRIFRT